MSAGSQAECGDGLTLKGFVVPHSTNTVSSSDSNLQQPKPSAKVFTRAVQLTHLRMCCHVNKSIKHQSNLAKGRIAPRSSSPGGSSNLQLRVSAGGLDPRFSLPLGDREPHLAQCVIGPHK